MFLTKDSHLKSYIRERNFVGKHANQLYDTFDQVQ